jgi:hypothetical protein
MTPHIALQALKPIALASSALDPDQLPSSNELMHWSGRLTHATVAAGSAILVALALHGVIFALLRRLGRRNQHHTEAEVASGFNQSVRWSLWRWACRSRLTPIAWSAMSGWRWRALWYPR